MTDTWNITAAYDKALYAQGETMTLSITGDFIHEVSEVVQVGPDTLTVVSATGQTETLTIEHAEATLTHAVHEDVVIDPSNPIIDAGGRTWTISADGKSITSVA